MTARGPVVIKLGGLAVEEPAQATELLAALVALHAASPGALLVVHGGGRAVDARLVRIGMETRRAAGLRVTPPEQMEEVAATLSGVVRSKLVAALCALGAPVVGISLVDGGLTRSRRIRVGDVDLGMVGEVTGGDAALARTLLGAGFLPVISSIGADETGALLNVNADDAAAAIAGIVGARLLVLLTDTPGVRGERGEVIESLDAQEAERLIAAGVIHGGMAPKVRAALRAAEASGAPTLIASWAEPRRLRELGTGLLPGTLVFPARAVVETRGTVAEGAGQ